MSQKILDNTSIQISQLGDNILDNIYNHHLDYVELKKTLSEVFSTNFDKEIGMSSITLYRLHRKITIHMQKDNVYKCDILKNQKNNNKNYKGDYD